MHDETRLLHLDRDDEPFRALTTPVHRASTLIFPTVEDFLTRHRRFYDGYSYGLYGHPASRALARQIAALEEGKRTLIVPSGMAAISVVNLALLRPGDHVLLPDAVYAPARSAAEGFLSTLGVTSTFYDPLAGARISELFQPTTRLVWVESPASFTMEVQDLPAIARAAHDRGALVAADCTWASPLGFKALRHGADIAVQALSKHVGGHSDLILGSVAVDDEGLYRQIKDASRYRGLSRGGAGPGGRRAGRARPRRSGRRRLHLGRASRLQGAAPRRRHRCPGAVEARRRPLRPDPRQRGGGRRRALPADQGRQPLPRPWRFPGRLLSCAARPRHAGNAP